LSRTVVFGKKGLKGQIIGQIWYKWDKKLHKLECRDILLCIKNINVIVVDLEWESTKASRAHLQHCK
jgi:hypothetical protein